MRTLLFLAAVVVAGPAGAGSMCPAAPKPVKDGDTWYIPEEAFTKAKAEEALKELKDLVDKGWVGRDFDAHNPTVSIKGYLYRSYLESNDNKYLKEEFCKFLRTEAYVSH